MIWVDGQQQEVMPACDRGLAYGDGFFTTMLVINGQLVNWLRHEQRLKEASERLKFPVLNWKSLQQMCQSALASISQSEPAVIKIIVTRGCGGKGYQPLPSSEATPRILVQTLPYPATDKTAVKIASKTVKNDQAWSFFCVKAQICQTLWSQNKQLAGLKHLNRLDNVLARNELAEGMSEGIMLDAAGRVISGTQSNIVLLKGKTLLTPNLDSCGIQGTFLASLKNWAPTMGYDWQEVDFDLAFLNQVDEVFFCNAVRGIMSMESLEGQPWSIKQGQALHQQIMTYLTNPTFEEKAQ
ncbi:aminodeoxychorismate lyase [Thiosulfativibrio zosterae]|uniref:Aminodeoxychorismate lyase n=1 Tax=Thiosulfativibrio zosterae TaxID=2675053 RepID=A0A6F8PP40_9GAMM|nr:aminodeoxychorismate lyase [Thiosulfativibrio zosterae]BBP43807.1 aminodeoxychorismate lyase [Thiosulfativibrio zosterae]